MNIEIEEFMHIKNANIELSPLLIFIGENNTGKSMLLKLLVGLIKDYEIEVDESLVKTKEFKLCKEKIMDNIGKTINTHDDDLLFNLFNKYLEIQGRDLVKNIFGEYINVGDIVFKNISKSRKIEIKKSIPDVWQEIKISNDETTFMVYSKLPPELYCENMLRIVKSLIEDEITPRFFVYHYPSYLSPDRSKMLEINQSQILSDFLDKKNYSLDFKDNDMLPGGFNYNRHGLFYYSKDLKQKRIPLKYSSSMVQNVVPIFLSFKNKDVPLYLIEEPESHLSLNNQKKIARLIVNTYNKIKTPIWITTHSDMLIQHFNNMIKLNNRDKKYRDILMKEFGYKKNDLLDSNDINIYQFEEDRNIVNVSKCELGKYGFIIPYFNKVMDDLFQESYAFQEDEE